MLKGGKFDSWESFNHNDHYFGEIFVANLSNTLRLELIAQFRFMLNASMGGLLVEGKALIEKLFKDRVVTESWQLQINVLYNA